MVRYFDTNYIVYIGETVNIYNYSNKEKCAYDIPTDCFSIEYTVNGLPFIVLENPIEETKELYFHDKRFDGGINYYDGCKCDVVGMFFITFKEDETVIQTTADGNKIKVTHNLPETEIKDWFLSCLEHCLILETKNDEYVSCSSLGVLRGIDEVTSGKRYGKKDDCLISLFYSDSKYFIKGQSDDGVWYHLKGEYGGWYIINVSDNSLYVIDGKHSKELSKDSSCSNFERVVKELLKNKGFKCNFSVPAKYYDR